MRLAHKVPQVPTGATGATGAVGPIGPQGPAGVGLVTGAILTLIQGSPAPAGFTKIGTTLFQYKTNNNVGELITLDVYVMN